MHGDFNNSNNHMKNLCSTLDDIASMSVITLSGYLSESFLI